MNASILAIGNQSAVSPLSEDKTANLSATHDEKLKETAMKFEASFIGQMLQYSGFADSLTSNGGQDVSAFTGFYIEQIATSIAEQGGFGMADSIYTQLKRFEAAAADKSDDSSIKL